MLGGIPQGEVRVGVSTEAIDLDIEALRRSLPHSRSPSSRRWGGLFWPSASSTRCT